MKKESHTEEIKKDDLPDYNYPFLIGKMLVGFVLLFYGGSLFIALYAKMVYQWVK